MMKKTMISLRRGLFGALLGAALMLPAAASAEVLFTETFNYPAGNLYPQGGWLQTANQVNPIQVTDVKMSREGFLAGNAIKLKATDLQDQDVMHPIVERNAADASVTPITSGDIYAAMLINVQALPPSNSYFFNFISTTSAGVMNDNKAFATTNGYTIISPSATEGKFNLAIHKSSNNATTKTEDLDLNTTYLLVLHWGIVDGTTNDVFEAWIDPTATKTAPTLSAPVNAADPSRGIAGIGISQFSNKAPEMLVGPIKVATTWEELFDGEGGGETPVDPVDPPAGKGEISATMSALPEGFGLYQYQSYPLTVNVKASGLTENITVGGLGSAITASTTSIPATEAMSEQGFDLTLTLNPTTSEQRLSETVTLTSGEAQFALPISTLVYEAQTLMNFRFAANAADYTTYYISGNARVTYVDAANNKMYLQDQVGGIAVGCDYLESIPFKAGDKVSKFYIMSEEASFGVMPFQLLGGFTPEGYAPLGTLVAENDFQTPIEISLADLQDDPDSYINRLVKVSDLTFASAGEAFTTTGTEVTSGTAKGRVRPFAGTDAIGTTIPEQAAVTGISTSVSAPVISVRSAADIEAPTAPAGIEFENTLLVEPTEYYPLGQATPFATLKVKVTNMTKPTSLWFGGKQRDSFSTDVEEIPAGTGEYTVNITFTPTVIGRNEAMLNFDAVPTELSTSLSVTALAYDPDNMPEFSVDSSAIEPFAANVGQTQEQTLTINAQNLLDYGTVRVLGQAAGAFRISSTSFLKSGATQLKVTFAPTAEGTFTEVIEFSTPKAQTLTVTVSGTTTGAAPEEPKQGDELSFDTSAPLAQYATSFNNSGENNKPLSLDGWKNVALDGTRAFWSYTADGNTMAKVTAYDSMADANAEAPAEMLLLSPALDYTASPTRLLQFSIMGEFLTDDMTDQFSVLYIDPTLPENERYQVIGGVSVPASADAAGEWRSFVLDLDGLDLADTFFIGFHYLSTRGRNTSAVYYVDDFAWGSTSTPFIRVDKTVAQTTASVGESVEIDEFTVSGLSLTEEIALSLEGAHKEHFGLSTASLPAEGGKFTATYEPKEEGEHAVYVVLRSAGAPETYITVGGTASPQNGIGSIEAADANGSTTGYYDLQGRRVYKPAKGGIYIRRSADSAAKVRI